MPDNQSVTTTSVEISSRFAAMMAAFCRDPVTPDQAERWEWQNYYAPKLRGAGFAERFIAKLSEWHPEQLKTFRLIDERCRNVGAIIALIGIRGVGKTAIASQMALARLQEWRAYFGVRPEERKTPVPRGMAIYRKMADVVRGTKALYADFGSIDTEAQSREREILLERSLLIVDEIHECDDQRMKNKILTDLVDIRYSNRRDTVLISNQTAQEFQASTTDSILSRLSEHGCIIQCEWESFRGGK